MRKFKLYYDKDAEETWLRELDEKGWALQSFCLGLYTFVPCRPGTYQYWIELLPANLAEQEAYLAFLKESGLEVVERWARWIYLRREKAAGPFTLYSDTASKMAQYRRIRRFFALFLGIEVIFLGVEAAAVLDTGEPIFLLFFTIILAVTLAFCRAVYQCSKKIRSLEEGMH